MNISTPVRNKIKKDALLNDREVIKKSQMVALRLGEYLDKLTAIIKSNLSNPKDDKYQSNLGTLKKKFVRCETLLKYLIKFMRDIPSAASKCLKMNL